MAPLLAFWLIPAEPEKKLFHKMIRDLGSILDAPVFEPHVTLYATHAAVPDRSETLLAQAARSISIVELHVNRVAFSSRFTKTLFVDFENSAELTRLSDQVRSLAPKPSKYRLQPHLSLVYKRLPESRKRLLASSIRLPFSAIRFTEIQMITGNPRTTDRDDVASWRTIHSHPLGG